MNKKIKIYIFILFFLTNILTAAIIVSPDNTIHTKYHHLENKINNFENNIVNYSSEKCYGIIIPYTTLHNKPYTSIQLGISNLINDLLRLNLSVYWAQENFTVLTRTHTENTQKYVFFEKGSFIIPYTSNPSMDNLITCIIGDYTYRSEIEEYYPVEAYFLLESIEVNVIKLNYAKTAYFNGKITHPWMLLYYFDLLQMGGFLDNKLYLENEIPTNLNNKDFNLFIWPGADPSMPFSEIINTSKYWKTSISIRDFVKNGGGYIGSCYGARSASSGIILPINILQYHFQNLPATLFLSLIPSTFFETYYSGITTIKLSDEYPVNYGLENTIKTYHMGPGPFFLWTAKNVKILGTFQEIDIQWIDDDYKNINPKILEIWKKTILGKPAWITSEFKKEKVSYSVITQN